MKKLFCMTLALLLLLSCAACSAAPAAAPTEDAQSAESPGPSSQMGVSLGSATETDEEGKAGDELADMEFAVLEDRIVGLLSVDENAKAYYYETINALFASLPAELGKYVAVVPTRIEFETEDVRAYADPQKKEIESVYFHLDQSITTIDMYASIAAHVETEPLDELYFRLDHHWTPRCAYYGAEAFFETVGMPYHKLAEYEVHDVGDFIGYAYAVAGNEGHLENPDRLVCYTLPGAEKSETVYTPDEEGVLSEMQRSVIDASYAAGALLTDDYYAYILIEGAPESDRALLMVGDSYMNSLAPWMADNFGRVVVVDPRFFTGGNEGLRTLIADNGITDVLVVDYTFAAMESFYITGMLGDLSK